MRIASSVGCFSKHFCMNWQLFMVSWIIILTEYAGSPTHLPCARPHSLFTAYRHVCRGRRLGVLYMGQQDDGTPRTGL